VHETTGESWTKKIPADEQNRGEKGELISYKKLSLATKRARRGRKKKRRLKGYVNNRQTGGGGGGPGGGSGGRAARHLRNSEKKRIKQVRDKGR